MWDERLKLRGVLENAILFALYLVVAKLGLMLDAVSGFATPVWVPTGLALAALLRRGYRLTYAVFLGALVVNLWAGAPSAAALGIATGNTLEALVGVWALRRFSDFRGSFDRLRHVLALIVPVALGSTLVSATVGVASLMAAGIVTRAAFWGTWSAWWLGDALGNLVVAPALLAWTTGSTRRPSAKRTIEATALFVTLSLACVAIFFQLVPQSTVLEYPFSLFPLLVWAAVRFELRGATAAALVVAVIALSGTVHGAGPFARGTLVESLTVAQCFVGAASVTLLVIAGAMADRQAAVRAREVLVASVSHDLRTPLGSIQMSAKSLLKALPEVAPSRIERHGELVQRNVGRMTQLIADLLDAAAIDADRISIEPREEDAGAIVKEAVDLLRPAAARKNQELGVDLPDVPDGVWVVCDRARMVQALSNLISNAIKFSAEGSTISVEAERKAHNVRFWVKDRGVGIAPAELRHVFDRYWRATPKAGGGTGLGLFITKGIIDAHGGTLWAESELSVGSTFQFTLPSAVVEGTRRSARRGEASFATTLRRAPSGSGAR